VVPGGEKNLRRGKGGAGQGTVDICVGGREIDRQHFGKEGRGRGKIH